jgi:hypothetical protein
VNPRHRRGRNGRIVPQHARARGSRLSVWQVVRAAVDAGVHARRYSNEDRVVFAVVRSEL